MHAMMDIISPFLGQLSFVQYLQHALLQVYDDKESRIVSWPVEKDFGSWSLEGEWNKYHWTMDVKQDDMIWKNHKDRIDLAQGLVITRSYELKRTIQ